MSPLTYILASYGIVALCLWRPMFRWFADGEKDITWGLLCILVIGGTVIAVTWGAWMSVLLLRRATHDDPHRLAAALMGESREMKRRRMAERIDELERELDLR